MFQFRRFPAYAYLIQRTLHRYCLCGLPHSEISGSKDICSSPKLIAAYRVLHRLLMPRHSPCALSSLTFRRSRGQSEKLVLLKNYAGFTKIEIVIVTLHPFGCCSTIKITLLYLIKTQNLSVALLHLLSIHCSVFKVRSPAPFEARS